MLIEDTSAADFARTLLPVSEGGPVGEKRVFNLPRLRISTTIDSVGYAALCRRALVDGGAPEGDDRHVLRLAVIDRRGRPDLPRPRWSGPTFSLGRLIDALEREGLAGSYDVDHDIWQVFDPAAGRGVQLLAEPGRFPPWEASFPLRNFLHWGYHAIGLRLIHAGTLGIGTTGVLLVGSGGSGKSGTTLAGVLAGLTSAGDDYVAVDAASAGPRAYAVSRLVKQDGPGLARLGVDPLERGFGAPNWQGKYEIALAGLHPGALAPVLQLRAILLPRVTGERRSHLRPATAHEAMMACAPSTLRQLPGSWKQGLATSASLARSLPAYHLALGSDGREVADCVADFIARA